MILVAVAAVFIWVLCLWAGLSALRRPGTAAKFKRLFVCVSAACLGILLTALLGLLHAFDAFSKETLVAQVTTRRLSPEEFELTYRPAARLGSDNGRGGGASEMMTRTIRLRGDQWAVSGGIVKWHPWLTALGVNSYHKPMRLSGQFSRADQQRAHYPTVYPLAPEIDRFWEAFYWADPYLPFVEAVYGSSAYAYVEPQTVQEIYVTPSGYLIKRVAY